MPLTPDLIYSTIQVIYLCTNPTCQLSLNRPTPFLVRHDPSLATVLRHMGIHLVFNSFVLFLHDSWAEPVLAIPLSNSSTNDLSFFISYHEDTNILLERTSTIVPTIKTAVLKAFWKMESVKTSFNHSTTQFITIILYQKVVV